jgi:hypothetical protein
MGCCVYYLGVKGCRGGFVVMVDMMVRILWTREVRKLK